MPIPTSMSNNLQHQIDLTVRRIGRLTFKVKMWLRSDSRPTSYPYISGDSFRKIADHIYDEQIKLKPEDVKIGDTIFVGQGLILEFLKSIHPNIKHKYILICHNGDNPIDNNVINLIDEKIGHFFAQDLIVNHPRVTPIPIGLENLHFYIAGVTPFIKKVQKKILKKPPHRKNRIFFNFSVNTNPDERGPAKKLFLNNPVMDTVTYFMTPRRHSLLLSTYKFVASPPGNAVESCRTWEALYFDTIPIVKDFVCMNYFKSLGLPIHTVKDWSELNLYSEESLAKMYDTMMSTASKKALYMDFWIDKINYEQTKLRQN